MGLERWGARGAKREGDARDNKLTAHTSNLPGAEGVGTMKPEHIGGLLSGADQPMRLAAGACSAGLRSTYTIISLTWCLL